MNGDDNEGASGTYVAAPPGGKSPALLFFLLGFGLFFVDYFFFRNFNGIDAIGFFKAMPQSLKIFTGGFWFIMIMILAVVWLVRRPNSREMGSWAILITILYACVTLMGWNPAAIVHIIFAMAILVIYLYPVWDRASSNYAISLWVGADFFLFSLIGELGKLVGRTFTVSRFQVPLWAIFVLIYPPGPKPRWTRAAIVIMVFFYLMVYAVPNIVAGNFSAAVTEEDRLQAVETLRVFVQNTRDFGRTLIGQGVKAGEEQIAIGAGPYYTGVVDENEDKPLGVYIQDVKTTYPYFYFDDAVGVEATVNVNALAEPVNVAMNCTMDEFIGDVSPDYYPDPDPRNFDIAKSEAVPVLCRFEQGILDQGVYRVNMRADFNFVTFAYIKRYFIDEETSRNVPIDTLLAGHEKNPSSHSTSGPAIITMTPMQDSPIIPVKGYTDTLYRFGFDIQNNLREDGYIKELTDVIMLLPEPMALVSDGSGYKCSHDFITASVSDCRRDCSNSELCTDVCNTAFEGHVGYRVDPVVLETEDRLKNIEDSRTFSCEAVIPASGRGQVLGTAPPGVHEFRVIAKYNSRAEVTSSPFEVRLRPGFNVFIEPIDATSSDTLTCKGVHTEKNINRAEYQFFRVEGESVTALSDENSASCNSLTRTCVGEKYGPVDRGTYVTCMMTAHIEGEDLPETGSKTIQIKNSPPVARVYFDPPEPLPGEGVSCVANITDQDGDGVSMLYTIDTKDPEDFTVTFNMPTGEAQCQPYSCPDGVPTCPDYTCSVPIDTEKVIARRIFRCKVTPHDYSNWDNDWGQAVWAGAYVRIPMPDEIEEPVVEEPVST